MKVAIIGDRGIPARYSGFSTLVEEIATRLVADHGADVTVYCRTSYYKERPPTFKGVRCVYLPAPGGKSFESIIHSFAAMTHAALFRNFDVVFVVDPGNAPYCFPLKLRMYPTLFHTDGLGWKRTKWSPLQRKYYKWSEKVCAALSTWLVTDSREMQRYYRDEYHADSTFIPYGSEVGGGYSESALTKFGITKGNYMLVVARLEPENNTDLAIQGYRAAGLDMPLVVVGGAQYESEFSRKIFAENDGKVRCVGGVYEPDALNGLYKHCCVYLHAHEVGGTNPSLLRAMGAGAACLPLNVPFHTEVLGPDNPYFEKNAESVAAKLKELVANPSEIERLRKLALHRSDSLYRWDAVAAGYHEVFRRMVEARKTGKRDQLATEAYAPERFVTAR